MTDLSSLPRLCSRHLVGMTTLLFLISGCSHFSNIVDQKGEKTSSNDRREKSSIFHSMDLNSESGEESASISFYSTESKTTQRLKANKNLKKKIQKWVTFFTTHYRDKFEDYLNNGEPYREKIEGILEEHQIPKELYYLPVIESGYVTYARSHMGAVGAWQFMESTGENYGLTVNYYLDERRNIHKSTQAAAAHLRDLYNIFGSWELALAAYNAGPHRIMGIIIKGSNREYWKLSELGILPRETSEYIPKFLAAVMIGEHPEKYGLEVNRDGKEFDETHAIVEVPSGLSLRQIAGELDLSYDKLQSLNLEYRRGHLPRYENKSEIIIPKSTFSSFKENKEEIASLGRDNSRKSSQNSGGVRYYRIRRGDTLGQIADRFGVSVKNLALVNGISNRARISVGQRLKINNGDFSGIYTVKRGDTLGRIARSFDLSVQQVKQINGLSTSRIYPGQRLRVSAHEGSFYVVQRGDTLWEIAQANGLSTHQLVRMNSLESTEIYAGQKLVVSE